jgi:Lactoylglutathione lyase and related lyases
MKIEHLAIWTSDLEQMREFYQKYFDMKCGKKYENVQKGFSSYFLAFESGARIEIMNRKDISNEVRVKGMSNGLTHFAISVGSIKAVDALTERLRNGGITIIGEPRTTGDGYYESVILDPEGNHVEITE